MFKKYVYFFHEEFDETLDAIAERMTEVEQKTQDNIVAISDNTLAISGQSNHVHLIPTYLYHTYVTMKKFATLSIKCF